MTDPGYGPQDDLRHWPAPGGKMRDSLFYELMMPEERLGLQIYLYLTDRGKTGYNVSVWGPEPVAVKLEAGTIGDDMDLDDFHFPGLSIKQPELRRTAEVSYRSDDVNIDFNFTALHDAFSYRSNPDGLPEWFALNRLEQTGHVTGFLEVGDRRIEWDRRIGHRDHSWGTRKGEPLVPTAGLGTAMLEPGYPTREELAERYAAATGRDVSGLTWYTALALWKLGVLYEYSRCRGEDPYYADPAMVRSFLAAARRVAGL